jgi:type I restriction enzyme R subunit
MLTAARWVVQDYRHIELGAAQGVAVREFPMAPGHGRADYLLFIDRKAAGVVEAKKAGSTLTGVEWQADKYTKGLPPDIDAWGSPLPFAYESAGIETTFTNANAWQGGCECSHSIGRDLVSRIQTSDCGRRR